MLFVVFCSYTEIEPNLFLKYPLAPQYYDIEFYPDFYANSSNLDTDVHIFFQENAELRKAAWDEWNCMSQQLSVTLRNAAERAYDDRNITLTQKQLFYMSGV